MPGVRCAAGSMHPAEAVESCADNRRLVFAMTVSRHPQAAAPRLLPRLWLLVAGVLAVGALARLGLWLDYAGAQRPGGLPPMLLWWGVRYDLAAGATLALLVGVACLLPWVLGRRAAAARWAEWLAVALLSALVLLAGCEHYYYAFYKTRFDPIVFGLFEDDTAAVLKTVWHDYPLVRGALAWAVCVVLLALGLPRLAARLDAHWPRSRSRALALVLAALQFVLLLAAARGGVGTFPLVRRDVTVSADPFVNALAPNTVFTLYRAARMRAEQVDIGSDVLAGVHRLGFRDLADAARAAGLAGTDAAQIERSLYAEVPGPTRTLARSPHVVLALLESFGADLLGTDGPGNDLLGRLREELGHGVRLRNFVAGQNGTHSELEILLLGSPVTPLTTGRNATLRFESAAALPFLRAGYRTVFLYGGGSDWRNVGTALMHQGFDRVFDARAIRERFPEAGATDWGVYDAYLFRLAQALLQEADARGERLFLVLLTTTNHPPFTLDTPHPQLPVNPAALGPRAQLDQAELRRTLLTYQYQADAFGGFLNALRHLPAGERTIVAAAGDHNLRSHYRYDLPAEFPDVDRVFAFLRVPDAYSPASGAPDALAYCSHADLVPTLVSLALPGARYFAGGRNLWQPPAGDDAAVAQLERVYTPAGVLFPLDAPLLHPWVDAHRIQPQGVAPAAAVLAQARRAAARVALTDWYIRTQVVRLSAAARR